MNIINPYRFAGGTGLLADYPDAAAAFSLRQLISTWTGAVVEVRRDGGSPATADFTASEVSDGTLTTWTGANNGFVSTWYDQSGNGFDATQTTDADQPVIVSSGTLVTSNGEPAIDFDGSNHYLLNAGNIPYNGGVSWYAVLDTDTNSATGRLWCDDITGAQGYVIFYTGLTINQYRINDNDTGFVSLTIANTLTTDQELRSFHFDDTTGGWVSAVDGSTDTGTETWTGPIDSSNSANFAIGGAGNSGDHLDGKMQELIIYPDDQSANRTGIEGNINDHYGIYV